MYVSFYALLPLNDAELSLSVDFMNLGADIIALGIWNAVELGKLQAIR